jgi:regulator of sigma E protease
MNIQIILYGLFILGILVFVHELGHFAAAKLFGIRVLAFSLGFGKVLFHRTIDGTDYRLSAFPFGGYVHMAGEYPGDKGGGAPDEYYAKPVWQRCIVALAGPALNILFAFFVLWTMYMYGEEKPQYLNRPIVGEILDSSAAFHAGFSIGDSITAINRAPVRSWHDIKEILAETETSAEPYGGLLPATPARIDSIYPGFPAEAAGIRKNDFVRAVNDSAVKSWAHFSLLVAAFDSLQRQLTLKILRDGAEIEVPVTPAWAEDRQRFIIGVTSGAGDPMVRIRYGPAPAVSQTLKQSWKYTFMIFVYLRRMVLTGKPLEFEIAFVRDGVPMKKTVHYTPRKIAPKDLSGPVGIVQISGGMVLLGFVPLLSILALISINLAVLNLMPFLVITDGGQVMFFLIEAVRKKRLSAKTQGLINRIAVAFFIALFLYITYYDILRIPQYFRIFRK